MRQRVIPFQLSPMLFCLLSFIVFTWALPEMAMAQSCECEVNQCGPCERAEGYTFYTEKCNNGVSIKSCKRFTCVPVENQPVCLAQLEASRSKSGSMTNSDLAQSQTLKLQASVPAPSPSKAIAVGLATKVDGDVLVTHQDQKSELRRGQKIYEGDLLETGANGRLTVRLIKKVETVSLRGPAATEETNNFLVLGESSRVTLIRHEYSDEEKRTLLHLWYGKLRSQVGDSYDQKGASYQIRGGAAIAGVRGTDFVTEIKQAGKELVTVITTLEGKVALKGFGQDRELEVPAEHSGSFVMPAQTGPFTDEELKALASQGYLTPVFRKNADELEALKKRLPVEVDRDVAGLDGDAAHRSLCQEPAGRFQQCLWRCENDGRGPASTCGEKSPCIRRVCNAAGEWNQPTRVGVEFCSPGEAKVSSCEP